MAILTLAPRITFESQISIFQEISSIFLLSSSSINKYLIIL